MVVLLYYCLSLIRFVISLLLENVLSTSHHTSDGTVDQTTLVKHYSEETHDPTIAEVSRCEMSELLELVGNSGFTTFVLRYEQETCTENCVGLIKRVAINRV